MNTTTYHYTGPNSAVTLKVADGAGGLEDRDVILWNGQNVDLPADHEVTQALEHQGWITPVAKPIEEKTEAEDKAEAAKPKSAK